MKAIIFDLDGTLWDATGQVYQIWNSVFARHPELTVCVTREDVSALAGKTMEEIGAALFPDMDEKWQRAIMDECGEEEVVYLRAHGGALYDGLREAVYVGDTAGDEAAARFAGIPFIHTAYGFGKAVSPDAIIHEIRELPRVVERILP